MTIWCSACKCHVKAPCASHRHLAEREQRALCARTRSTKGASKARRDHINREIRNMRALLPIAPEDQERLSYLHSMAAICTYIRKSVLLEGLRAEEAARCPLPYEAFLQALRGFVLVTTAQGRLVYVSENVAQFLGISMVDVLQGDTFYDMVERSDIDIVKSNLDIRNNASSERSFVCRMQTSKTFRLQQGSCCSVLVRGSFRWLPRPRPSSSGASRTSEPLFVALCSPTVGRLAGPDSLPCPSFTSLHRLNMTFTWLSHSVLYHLGYSAEEMTGRSWYGLIHPEDLSSSADSHRSLMETEEGFQVEMVLRLQCQDLSWTWIYMRAFREPECQGISCTNYIISETEARFLQKKVGSDAFRTSSLADSCGSAAQQEPHSQSCNTTKCFKRQRSSEGQSEEPPARVRRRSERCVYSRGETPPWSPASSGSPLPQDELSRDLLMDVSSPEASPSYYTYPEAALNCHSLPAGPEHTFQPGSFASRSPLPSSSSSPACDYRPCTSDARLVPDLLSASDVCRSPVERDLHQDAFCFPEQPDVGVHHVPCRVSPMHSGLLTPIRSPASAESDQYNEREQAEISILAQQISSLARSFDLYRNLNPVQSAAPASACDWPPKCATVLEDGVFDSILKDLDMVPRKSTGPDPAGSCSYRQHLACGVGETLCLSAAAPLDPLPSEHFASMDPFGLQSGRREQNPGLHQLNHFTQNGLQQDGLAEENLY